MSIQEANTLILELKKVGFVTRMFKYGPIKSIGLAFSSRIDGKLNKHLSGFLEKLDKIIIYLDNRGFSPAIKRQQLSELYAVSKINNKDPKTFFKTIVDGLTNIVISVVKSSIDYTHSANLIDLTKINSLNTFVNIQSSDTKFKEIQSVINEFPSILTKMPNTFLKEIFMDDNIYVDPDLIKGSIDRLNIEIKNHVIAKVAINQQATAMIKSSI